MATHHFFGATCDDVRRRLPGDLAQAAPSLVEAAMGDAEARVEAALPERYRRLLSRVEGEVIVPSASEGQLTAALGLPAARNLVLYADLAGPYPDRTAADEMPPARYQLAESGEYVTFSPALSRGTRVLADYETTLADGVRVLADLVAVLAAAEVARPATYGRPEFAQALAREGAERLAALADGRLGVPELDALRLYDDWERTPRGLRCGHLVRS